MNILLIGNGFDLAHGLYTKYDNFLDFAKVIRQVIDIDNEKDFNNVDWKVVPIPIKEIIKHKHNLHILELEKQTWKELLNENVWIDYFMSIYEERTKNGKDGWIDFESEISEVIQSIDQSMGKENFYSNIIRLKNEFFNDKYTNNVPEYLQATAEEQNKIRKPEITYKRLRDILLEDLNKLIRALEIYIAGYIEKIEIGKISDDIKNLEIDHLLSFNYSHTYQKLYGKSKIIEYDYIHGEADINKTIATNNMVLGIDEYLPEDRRNKDVEFIAFKKFYQRIHKETGCKYKEWVDIIKDEWENETEENKAEIRRCISKDRLENKKIHRFYIFGHSLDVTDKDILRDLILNDNVHTTIFYLNKDVKGQQIANLVKVIGQDELIRRTGGSTKTIEFKLQQEMIETNPPVFF